MENWSVELIAEGQTLEKIKSQTDIFQGDPLSPLVFVVAMMQFNYLFIKRREGYKFSKSQQKINRLIYVGNIMVFTKNEKELEILIKTIKIYCQDIGMEFSIEKCKSKKRINRRNRITESKIH